MKCPNCDGSGIVNEPIYNKSHTLIKNWAIKKCDICNGSGEYVAEPMTNEEWLQTCTTEELSKFLTDVVRFCYKCGNNGFMMKTCKFGECQCNVGEWLKEVHKE